MPEAASTGASRRLPPSRIAPAGRWGIWLDAQRRLRGLPLKVVYHDLRTRWPDLFPWLSDSSLDSYRAFEKGKSIPDADQEAAFLAYFEGSEAPPVETPGEDVPGVSAYLERIDALVVELAEDRRAWAKDRALIVALLAQLRQSQAEQDAEAEAHDEAAAELGSQTPGGLGGDHVVEPPAAAPPATGR